MSSLVTAISAPVEGTFGMCIYDDPGMLMQAVINVIAAFPTTAATPRLHAVSLRALIAELVPEMVAPVPPHDPPPPSHRPGGGGVLSDRSYRSPFRTLSRRSYQEGIFS